MGLPSEPNNYYARSYLSPNGNGDPNLTTLKFEVKSFPNVTATNPLTLTGAGNVGIGTTTPTFKLHVFNDSGTAIFGQSNSGNAGLFYGYVALTKLDTGGFSNNICINSIQRLSTCGSSLRYKTNVQSFRDGLSIINRLRPISFTWKEGGMKDLGLAAEEVEKVEPLLTFRNNKGEIEGVKYNQLSAVFINAFKEQQAQIEKEQDQLKRQQAQIKQQEDQARQQQSALAAQAQELKGLKNLVCRSHRRASVCK